MATEMRGFVFAVIFIVIFSTLLYSVPAGLQGPDEDPDTIIPVDPSIVSGFEETENWTRAAYLGTFPKYYDYDLGAYSWRSLDFITSINLGSKIWFFFLWLGGIDYCKFISPEGQDRDITLELTEITADADNGSVRYSLEFTQSGDSGGALVCYWNTTLYDNATIAWANDALYLLHGMGISNTATNNIAALLVSLLLLQLPDVPVLVNIFIAVPLWACIVYVLWYVLKEMIPFV